MLRYTKDNIPKIKEFSRFTKKRSTYAVRLRGPFEVETREGTLTCPDGWLALDSECWPYPIAATEFERIYTPEKPADVSRPKGDYYDRYR